MKPKLTWRTFLLVIASVAAVCLLLFMFTRNNLPPIWGSLSEEDARAVLKEFDRVRWRPAYVYLRKWEFRLFMRVLTENLKLHPVPVYVEGDGTQAVVECRNAQRCCLEGY
jgi:hypothetical protein